MANDTFPAIVAFPPSPSPVWKYMPHCSLSSPSPGPHELIIRMVATGVCHTDVFTSSIPPELDPRFPYPRIQGHEGAGYVEAIGSDVSVAKVGDPVLLSYDNCGECTWCEKGEPTYCTTFSERNTHGTTGIFKVKQDDGKEVDAVGKYFGQSSFAGKSVVQEKSVVNVKDLVKGEEEMKVLAPLGCGLMTGSGAVVNVAKAGEGDVFAIFGVGGVGLGAIMAAKARGCKKIIAVDRIKSRLEMAKEVGATHAVDTTGLPVDQIAAKVQEAVGERIGFVLETTGVPGLVQEGMKALGMRGTLIHVGIPPFDGKVEFSMLDVFFQLKIYCPNILGDAKSREALPMMIKWWREGKFPIEKFEKFFDAKDAEKALEGMEDGSAIKPILVW